MARRMFSVCFLGLSLIVLSSLSTPVLTEGSGSTNETPNDLFDWVERVRQKPVGPKADPGTNYATSTSTAPPVIVVDKDGNGDFKTIGKAIDAIPKDSSTRYTIQVNAGVYKEKLKIPSNKGPITLQGAGYRATYITFDDDAAEAGSTFKSASVSVESDDFIAKDIAFENTSPSPPPGAVGRQAVALMISGDKGAFYRCAFLGYQDTLYDKAGRHYFLDCYIRGSIDYVFGDGLSLYESCYLDSVATTFGSVSAQKRSSAADDTGFSFLNCNVTGTGYIYLSRAWGPWSRVVFIRSYLDEAIRPEGWSDWGIPARDKTVYYGEYECYGPGSVRSEREPWSLELTGEQAAPFMTVDWIDGNDWLPSGPQ